MTVKEFKDLPGFSDKNTEELSSIGITTVDQLKDAVSDAEKSKEIVKALTGVGPKTIEKWQAAFAGEEVKAPAKKEAKEEEAAEVVEANAYAVQPKPELDDETVEALAQRAVISGKRPAFKRQEWYRYKMLGEMWRKPRGIHSKMRRRFKKRPAMVEIGYRGPAKARDLHPSGFEEVMVYNAEDLEKIDPKKQAARIGRTVGTKKRVAIEDRAKELGIRVLNRMV
ncbi:50S ribosomal protein L32e [Candidatus Methanomethylophilus sp. 1R26]|uniref:50S ribosomal protein L32e n=1 Tax=Candidatus Methanomethylophilus sp. 1R26 TaxID=1769296 RepID=UPI0009E7BBE5|nr:50S ribosomal protein L32e [Candidatus Methanomethylophilus sp. 1R26]